MRAQILNYKGKAIFYMDFSGLKTENQISEIIDICKTHIFKQSLGSTIGLVNIEEMFFNNNVKDMFLDFVKGNKPYMKASAVIGVTGLKKIMFNAIMKLSGRDVRSFDTLDLAKEWLISQK